MSEQIIRTRLVPQTMAALIRPCPAIKRALFVIEPFVSAGRPCLFLLCEVHAAGTDKERFVLGLEMPARRQAPDAPAIPFLQKEITRRLLIRADFRESKTIMNKTSLFLTLLLGFSSGIAGAAEKGMAVAIVAGNPDGSWFVYETAILKAPVEAGDGDSKMPTPPFLRWEPLFSENACTSCRADAGEAVPITRLGANEDFVYQVAKALQWYKDEFLRNDYRAKLPPHRWELEGEYDDDFVTPGDSVPVATVAAVTSENTRQNQ